MTASPINPLWLKFFTAEPHSTWLVRWAMRRTHPTLPPPIGHQQLRVEVTWAMRRTHPTLPPIGHWKLRVEVTWVMRRTHPIPLWSSAVESWSDMNNEGDPPCPTPHWPSAACPHHALKYYTAVSAYWDPRGLARFFFQMWPNYVAEMKKRKFHVVCHVVARGI